MGMGAMSMYATLMLNYQLQELIGTDHVQIYITFNNWNLMALYIRYIQLLISCQITWLSC